MIIIISYYIQSVIARNPCDAAKTENKQQNQLMLAHQIDAVSRESFELFFFLNNLHSIHDSVIEYDIRIQKILPILPKPV